MHSSLRMRNKLHQRARIGPYINVTQVYYVRPRRRVVDQQLTVLHSFAPKIHLLRFRSLSDKLTALTELKRTDTTVDDLLYIQD